MRRTAAALVAVLLLSILPAAASGGPAAAQDEAAIRALIEKVEAANNAGDVDGWVELFADAAVYMPPGVPAVTTREGLVQIAEAGFRNDASIRIEPLEIRVFGDWAFARSEVSGTVTVHGSGEVVEVDAKQLVIYSRDDTGRWRIARLIVNSNTE